VRSSVLISVIKESTFVGNINRHDVVCKYIEVMRDTMNGCSSRL